MERFNLESELKSLQEVKNRAAKLAVANMDATVHNMARQFFDHLDAAALFFQQLCGYIASKPEAVEKAANEAAANGTIVGGPAGGPQA